MGTALHKVKMFSSELACLCWSARELRKTAVVSASSCSLFKTPSSAVIASSSSLWARIHPTLLWAPCHVVHCHTFAEHLPTVLCSSVCEATFPKTEFFQGRSQASSTFGPTCNSCGLLANEETGIGHHCGMRIVLWSGN